MSLVTWTPGIDQSPQPGLGKTFWEAISTGTEKFAKDNSQLTRRFYIDHDVRYDFIDDLIGYSIFLPDGTISRPSLPDEHPTVNGFFAVDAEITPKETGITFGSGGEPIFGLAEVAVNYIYCDYAILSDDEISTDPGSEINRYCQRRYGFSSEILQTGLGAFKSVTNQDTLPFSPGKITGTITKTIKWLEVPALPSNPFLPPTYNICKDLLGTANSAEFDGEPVGSCVFMSVENEIVPPRVGQDGLHHWNITYVFGIKDNGSPFSGDTDGVAGWNYLWSPKLGIYDLYTSGVGVSGSLDGDRLYAETDLRLLFESFG